MRKTILSKYSIPLALLIIFMGLFSIIPSCGSGGGGGGGGNGGISYTGLTTQASLTASNANKIFAVMWYGGASPVLTSPAPAISKAEPSEYSRGNGVMLLITRIGNRMFHEAALYQNAVQTAKRATPVNETYHGSISGTLTITGSLDANTGTGNLTMTYTNYNDGDGYTADGTVTARIDGYDFMYDMITDMTMNFKLLTLRSAIYDMSMSGSMRLQESAQTNSDTMTINVVTRDNASKETSRFENYVQTTTYDNIMMPTSASETYTGRVYAEKYGYVDVSTISPCMYTNPQAAPDSGGPIIFSGAGNTKARITPLSTSNVSIEVDDDGDDVFEAQNAYSWGDLEGPPVTTTGSLTISGVVNDPTGSSPVPVASATVTVRKTDNSAVAATTTGADGSFTLTNVPASTDVYVNISKATYASRNTEIISITDNVLGAIVNIYPETMVKSIADALTGSSGGGSWSDPFYTGMSWFAVSVWSEVSNTLVSGITVNVAPSGPAILYNNGSNVYSPVGPTVVTTNMPQIGGYHSSEGVYTFTLTKSTNTHTIKLPLVKGELTYGDLALSW